MHVMWEPRIHSRLLRRNREAGVKAESGGLPGPGQTVFSLLLQPFYYSEFVIFIRSQKAKGTNLSVKWFLAETSRGGLWGADPSVSADQDNVPMAVHCSGCEAQIPTSGLRGIPMQCNKSSCKPLLQNMKAVNFHI